MPTMDKFRQINYWTESAKHDLDVAETLFDSGKYDRCLFIAHLVLEKTKIMPFKLPENSSDC